MELLNVDDTRLSEDYWLVEQAIRYLTDHPDDQPSLKEIARQVNMSEFQFQRLFTRWVGVSPKRFMQYLAKERAKELLKDRRDLLEVTYATGLSSPGRLHDLFVTCEAVTPGEFKQRGRGLRIAYGVHPSPFGDCLLATTDRGICNLIFLGKEDRGEAKKLLKTSWPKAELIWDPAAAHTTMGEVFEFIQGKPMSPLRLYLSGTNFQIKVWEALLQIPTGTVVSYGEIAFAIGMPSASRAVGHAVGSNPIPVIIPCHRVILKSGAIGEYRWGAVRKRAILGWEAAYRDRSRSENAFISEVR